MDTKTPSINLQLEHLLERIHIELVIIENKLDYQDHEALEYASQLLYTAHKELSKLGYQLEPSMIKP